MAFNEKYEQFMESQQEDFFVDTDSLYGNREKLEQTVESINGKKYSKNRGNPILVSKLGEGKYYVVDGNHRALEYAHEGRKRVRVSLFDYKQDIEEDKTLILDPVPVTEFIDMIKGDIEESKIPNSVPRYLYYSTYKQMLPTIKRDGGLKVGSFLKRSYKEALDDAELVENLDQDWKDNIIVFKINTGKLNHKRFEVDNNDDPSEYSYQDVVPTGCLVRNG